MLFSAAQLKRPEVKQPKISLFVIVFIFLDDIP